MPAPLRTPLRTILDADATVSKIEDVGGLVLLEPIDVMDAGRFAIARDPGGPVFGIWQARQFIGFGIAYEPGSVCWNENWSRNYEGNKAFYAAVFAYKCVAEDENVKYATLYLDGRPVGGIGEMGERFPAEIPASWNTYFGVEDTEAAVARVNELGGKVSAPPWDTEQNRTPSALPRP